jgi:hypothetical protein
MPAALISPLPLPSVVKELKYLVFPFIVLAVVLVVFAVVAPMGGHPFSSDSTGRAEQLIQAMRNTRCRARERTMYESVRRAEG